MVIDAMPANLPKYTMRISLKNVSCANMAAFAAIRPNQLILSAVKDLSLENIDYGGMASLDIGFSKIKSIENVQFKDPMHLSLTNATIQSIRNIDVRDLNDVWFSNTQISNWLMDTKTFIVFNSIPQGVWQPQSGGMGLSRGYHVKDSSITFDKSLCDKQSGSLKNLWSQANLVVCVVPQPSLVSGSPSGVLVGIPAATVIALAAKLAVMYKKKVAALSNKYEATQSPTLTQKSIA
ncbi:Aste57867_12562 [Aphanomyces stellatus]|uniref:Aste57867_12562 protein n=1 Tax=Aphanomyces stellatus TaxID=120398 RepID=A0A485KWQ2_9STRA|nr:hypothetical protein As57867_012516 [Aphanomyces stellatus]VFT89413.1 Aste57867_12562 [Aphanomyces stellatus]